MMRFLRRAYRRVRGLSWGLIAIALVMVFVLGTIGVRKHLEVAEPNKSYSASTVAFFVLQMLGLDWGAVPEPVGWELETARLLAVLVFLGAILKAVLAFLKRPLEGLWLKHMASGHSIVCGLGDKGDRIAQQLLDRGDLVAVVERNESLSAVDELRERGALVIVGDALHPGILRNAGVCRCRRLVATCGNDARNLGVGALAVEATSAGAKAAAPVVHVHCMDPAAFDLYRQNNASGTTSPITVDVRRFNIPENTARLLLDAYPLDRERIRVGDPLFVRLILLGRSAEAEGILLHAASLAHFANSTQARITVIAPDADLWNQSLHFRFPEIDKTCHLEFVKRDCCHPDTRRDIERLLSDPHAVTTIVIAPEDGRDTLTLAARLPDATTDRGVRVLMRTGFRGNFSKSGDPTTGGFEFVAFDTLKHACELESVLGDNLDNQAKVMHDAFVRKAIADGRSPVNEPALQPWDLLPETYRQSNRRNADHIPVKLRAIGCTAKPIGARVDPPWAFSPEEIEVLARMEHARWNADRWLDGWRLGPKKEPRLKIHHNLVPWEDLDERTKAYDREAVRQIPAMLAEAGKGVARDEAAG